MEATQTSIEQVIRNEPEWAKPADFAVLRGLIAKVVNKSPLAMKNEQIEAVLNAALARDPDAFKLAFDVLFTESDRKPIYRERIDRTMEFFRWYVKNLPPSRDIEKFRMRRWMQILLVITGAIHRNDRYTAHTLRQIIWRRGISDNELREKISDASEKLGLQIAPQFIDDELETTPDKQVDPSKGEETSGRRCVI